MKKLYLLIILFVATFIATQAQAQPGDTVRVLFLGNSFIASNNMPHLFEELARQAGRNVIVRTHAPGGVYIGDTRSGASHAYSPVVHNLLKQEKWDYVVAQDNQGHYSYTVGWFPSYAEVYKGHQIIADSLRKSNPCGKLILFSGWCFRNGYPGEFPDGKSMNQRVYENYVHVNKTLKEIVSPIGIAWNRVMDSIPPIELWSPDEAHPSLEGSYVTAATIYATIFRSNFDSARFDAGINPRFAETMRRTAFKVVMDSLVPTALSAQTLSLTAGPAALTAGTGFRTYEWYRNGARVSSGPLNTYTPTANGCYQVIGADAMGCKKRSAVLCFNRTAAPAGLGTLAAGSVQLFPNPTSGAVTIGFNIPVQDVSVTVYDAKGSIVHEQQLGTGAQFRCDLGALPAGLYQLRIRTSQGIMTERLQLLR